MSAEASFKCNIEGYICGYDLSTTMFTSKPVQICLLQSFLAHFFFPFFCITYGHHCLGLLCILSGGK